MANKTQTGVIQHTCDECKTIFNDVNTYINHECPKIAAQFQQISNDSVIPSSALPLKARSKYAEWKKLSKDRLMEELETAEMRCELMRLDLRERDTMRLLSDPDMTEQDLIKRERFDPERLRAEIEAKVKADYSEKEQLAERIREKVMAEMSDVREGEEEGDFTEQLLAQLAPDIQELIRAYVAQKASSLSPAPPLLPQPTGQTREV